MSRRDSRGKSSASEMIAVVQGSGSRAELGEQLVELIQRLGVASQRVGHLFAARAGLHPTDLEALLHVMHAERRGEPMTAGALATALGVTTGAATGVIDRLERDGHLARRRDDRDRRRVLLGYADSGRAVADEFFGPLGRMTDQVLDGFGVDGLRTVARFLTEVTDAMTAHAENDRSPASESRS